jgi:hypothetical protein
VKRVVFFIALAACTREDGEPDPPIQVLVPCDPAAPAGGPLACPVDAGVDAVVDATAAVAPGEVATPRE